MQSSVSAEEWADCSYCSGPERQANMRCLNIIVTCTVLCIGAKMIKRIFMKDLMWKMSHHIWGTKNIYIHICSEFVWTRKFIRKTISDSFIWVLMAVGIRVRSATGALVSLGANVGMLKRLQFHCIPDVFSGVEELCAGHSNVTNTLLNCQRSLLFISKTWYFQLGRFFYSNLPVESWRCRVLKCSIAETPRPPQEVMVNKSNKSKVGNLYFFFIIFFRCQYPWVLVIT